VQTLCITLLLGLSSDSDHHVRAAAIRALGCCVLYPCLREVRIPLFLILAFVARIMFENLDLFHSSVAWLGRRTCNREVAGSSPGRSSPRNNSGQVVHTHVPLFTKQYKLVPAQAGS